MRIHVKHEWQSYLVVVDSKNGSCGFKLNKLINMCNRESVTVHAIPSEEEKNATLEVTTEEIKGEEIELKLTPPIITAWAYQLAKGLHEGM
jgi:hypothetical protein